MRPHIASLPRGRCLYTVGRLPRTLSSRPYALHNGTHRPSLTSQSNAAFLGQKRWYTKQHLARMEDARRQWAGFAKEIKEGKRLSFLQHIESRGLVHNVVGDRDLLHRIFTEKRVGMYAGFDPTGPSLHVGHMLPVMILAWGYVWGLPVTFVLGGATARVGDPTGRSNTRDQQHSSVRKANMANMHMQLKKLGSSIEKYGAKHGYKYEWAWRRALTNNNVWFNSLSLTEWLRDLGSHMRLGPMLGRETVKNRLNSGEGMSFAELCYPLMQAWDWWTLFQKGVQVQIGGSDQYGNILFGMDSVKQISKKTVDQEAHNDLENELDWPVGITTPLLTATNGEKIGKSAGNGVWLDKDLTSPFELYQYFVRTPDDQVERYLKLFTFLPLGKIEMIMEQQNQDPSRRIAQHTLATEFVELIHGSHEARAVSEQHRALFGGRLPQILGAQLANDRASPPMPTNSEKGPSETNKHPNSEFINPGSGNKHAPQTNFANMPSLSVTLPESLVYNRTFNKILWHAGMVSSRNEGHRIINNRGAHVGARPEGPVKGLGRVRGEMPDELKYTPIKQWEASLTKDFILEGGLLILKVGKWKIKIVKVVSDQEFQDMGGQCPGWDSEKGCPSDLEYLKDGKEQNE